ncbi:MAG TPA: hypothetical protein VI796_02150 [Candidatus Thermoplasmatota archaeon]|nr:hypothetical protein [Candidatus Thermoplasmatota archaeon]
MSGRGRLLWEYRPPRAHPIVYAALMLTLAVFVLGSLENLLRSRRPELYGYYALPPLLLLAGLLLFAPGPVRIHDEGIAPSRPLFVRRWRPFLRWDDAVAVYPAAYDVTGGFVSPFASSDGKVTQTGLAVEDRDGRTEVVRFTPTRYEMGRRRSRGFDEAYRVVRGVFASRGRPLVAEARSYTAGEQEAMLQEARAPFLPFWAIVVLFASAAPIVLLLVKGLGLEPWAAIALGAIPALSTSTLSYRRSRRRNRILGELAKSAEAERGRAA